MYEPFRGRIGTVRVRVWRKNEVRRRRRERTRREEWSEPDLFFLHNVWTGSVQNRPILPCLWPLDLGLVDPDQSNAPEAFWRSGSTSVWVGPVSIGLLFFFFLQFHGFLANCTYVLLPEPLCVLNFLPKKIPKSYYVFLDAFFDCFVVFLHFKMDKNVC